jgi:menaquinone-specific isochorismate synthase
MSVTPYRTNLFQDHKELYQLLFRGKQQSVEKDCPQIVSISQEIEQLDPLSVLQTLARPNQLHFYFEKRSNNEAIAAIDAVAFIKIEGINRYQKSQSFIKYCLANIISNCHLSLPFAGPHFFCSFTFNDEKLSVDSPFHPATVFLPRWQISIRKNSCVLVANIEVDYKTNLEVLLESFCTRLKIISWSGHRLSNINKKPQNKFIKQATQNAEGFKLSVLSALESIQAKQFSKIVLANAIDVVSLLPFNLVNSLNNLRSRYPDCSVFSINNGKGKTFIGASPERLISIQNHQLVTDALAGSAPRGKTAIEDAEFAHRLLSSEKERREHQFVLDFITERLSYLGLVPHLLPTPQLRQLSNIQHLWTPIQAQIPIDVHPLDIVAQLHPTPAVAGVPRDIALRHIRRYEHFDRCLYAAPLGWIDHQGNSEFIVGIRSALIDGSQARLYAGVGIVAGSDPDKELVEIQLKLQALLKALL